MNILIVSGSLHSDSYSRAMAEEALRLLQAEPGVTVTLIDLRTLPLPPCDGEKAYSHPETHRAVAAVSGSDAILLATPIYNYDASATVKNLVELTGKAWENKVVGFLCAAGGANSYMSIMPLANSLMLDFRCVIVPRFVYATGAAFTDSRLSDLKIVERVAELVSTTVKLTKAVKTAGLSGLPTSRS